MLSLTYRQRVDTPMDKYSADSAAVSNGLFIIIAPGQ